MKKGYFYSLYPSEIKSRWDYIYHIGARGRSYEATFMERWHNEDPFKRGVIMIPILSPAYSINDCASLHLQLLQEINVGMKDTYATVIIDYMSAPTEYRYGFDELRAYIGYIKKYWTPFLHGKKVLLRISASTLNAWLRDMPNDVHQTFEDTIEPLVAQWTYNYQPAVIVDYGKPKYWEHANGVMAVDLTQMWIESPNAKPAEDETPVEDEQPAADEKPVEETWHTLFAIGKFRLQFKTI